MPPSASLTRRWRSRLGLRLYRWRISHTRRIYTARDGSGFALVGPVWTAASTARTYLGEDQLSTLRVRRAWSPEGALAFARRAARRRGLAVFAPDAAEPALRGELLALDHYLPFAIPLPATREAYLAGIGQSLRRQVRLLLARGYRAECLRAPEWAGEFLHRFHDPTTRSRHGDDGFHSSPEDLTGLFARTGTEWLRVYQGEDCVAALVGERVGEDYRLHRLGWRDGSPELLAADVSTALYWFGIVRAFELGLRALHLGGVPADLRHGLFFYKAKWGARLRPREAGIHPRHLLLDPAHPTARRYLATHALLARDRAGGFVVLSGLAPSEVNTYPGQARFISAWFRLRDAPAATTSADLADSAFAALPAPLRPWFDLTALPG